MLQAQKSSGAGSGGTEGTAAPGWLRRLTGYCWQYRRNVLLSLGASLVGMAVTALTPLIPRLIIDDVIVTHTRPLVPWAGTLVAAAVVVFALTYVRRYYGGKLALDVQHDLRRELFS
jgi:ATP-binding cassette subfamily B protein